MPDVPDDLMAFLRGVKPEDIAKRVKVGNIKCPFCGSEAVIYKGDPRSRGWYRYECEKGHWGDRQSL